MFDKFKCRLTLEGTVETVTAIRIGAGRSTSPVSADLPVVRDAANLPYIPGSSFKGVLRSYVESILRGFTSNKIVVCNPTTETESCITIQNMNGLREERRKNKWGDGRFSKEILDQTCWVCQLFGSSWYASKLQIRDLHVKPELWFDQYQQRDGVAIDRDTETASDGKLYDYEVVPAGVLFDFHAIVDNAEDWQLGMLYMGLFAFKNGRLTIGGGSSRGLGLINLSLDSEYYIGTDSVMKYLTDADYDGESVDWEPWVAAFKAKIKHNRRGVDAQADCQPSDY